MAASRPSLVQKEKKTRFRAVFAFHIRYSKLMLAFSGQKSENFQAIGLGRGLGRHSQRDSNCESPTHFQL